MLMEMVTESKSKQKEQTAKYELDLSNLDEQLKNVKAIEVLDVPRWIILLNVVVVPFCLVFFFFFFFFNLN
jgi:hypothetical protein